jgi:protoheme IX farnesyltransferase
VFKLYSDLTKFGIVIFVVLSGLAGYATSYAPESVFNWEHFLNLIGGLYFLSSGSLALNQVQDSKMDRLMPRTARRPIASGKITPAAAAILAGAFLLIGSDLLFKASAMAGTLGWVTVVLYNGFYTLWWKKKWVFAAIPGALPGALPVTIGYAANNENIWNRDSVYLFLIMFLWQMPHFWTLAMRYREDYAKAGVPTLPVALGIPRTLYHMGLWTFLYVTVAVASPWFVQANWMYLLLVFPFAFKVIQEFYRYYTSQGEKRWLAFFMWTNLSMLVFLFVPVLDKWSFLLIKHS